MFSCASRILLVDCKRTLWPNLVRQYLHHTVAGLCVQPRETRSINSQSQVNKKINTSGNLRDIFLMPKTNYATEIKDNLQIQHCC